MEYVVKCQFIAVCKYQCLDTLKGNHGAQCLKKHDGGFYKVSTEKGLQPNRSLQSRN